MVITTEQRLINKAITKSPVTKREILLSENLKSQTAYERITFGGFLEKCTFKYITQRCNIKDCESFNGQKQDKFLKRDWRFNQNYYSYKARLNSYGFDFNTEIFICKIPIKSGKINWLGKSKDYSGYDLDWENLECLPGRDLIGANINYHCFVNCAQKGIKFISNKYIRVDSQKFLTFVAQEENLNIISGVKNEVPYIIPKLTIPQAQFYFSKLSPSRNRNHSMFINIPNLPKSKEDKELVDFIEEFPQLYSNKNGPHPERSVSLCWKLDEGSDERNYDYILMKILKYTPFLTISEKFRKEVLLLPGEVLHKENTWKSFFKI